MPTDPEQADIAADPDLPESILCPIAQILVGQSLGLAEVIDLIAAYPIQATTEYPERAIAIFMHVADIFGGDLALPAYDGRLVLEVDTQQCTVVHANPDAALHRRHHAADAAILHGFERCLNAMQSARVIKPGEAEIASQPQTRLGIQGKTGNVAFQCHRYRLERFKLIAMQSLIGSDPKRIALRL
ncbi:MAG: hypothetical protein BWZ07_02954 [Alphaproteobacteria bacterium ADurb.BinA280]|nr:MAG: hypothetical protein BWZ07_02954 [Alphaproteobacteria bacterium ADurb.BinA280]